MSRLILFDAFEDSKYETLSRHVEVLKELNINTLLVHSIDPAKPHTKCMQLLADNGIYVLFKLAGSSISENMPIDVDETALRFHSRVIDCVAKYRNTLGVCVAGNLVRRLSLNIRDENETVWHNIGITIREMKKYMRFRNHDTGQRILPIGIAEPQRSSLYTKTFEYFTEADKEARPAGGNIDFYCFSHYDTDNDPHVYTTSSSAPMNMSLLRHPNLELRGLRSESQVDSQEASNSNWGLQLPLHKFTEAQNPVPVIISEYGSNLYHPRIFGETRQLYGRGMDSQLLQVLSGGFVHEYEDLRNGYGLVTRKPDGTVDTSSQEYANFRDAMADAVWPQRDKAVDSGNEIEPNTERVDEQSAQKV